MKAMIFAAGLGTRLKPFTENNPKALAVVAGKTLLEHSIRYLQQAGIYDVVLNVHHFAGKIYDLLDKENGFGSNVQISDEQDELLETGGGLQKASTFFDKADPAFVAMNVDVLTTLDLKALIAAHTARRAMATLAVMNRPSSRQLLFDANMQLCGWRNNATGALRTARNCDNTIPFAFTGIQVLSTTALDYCTLSGKFSLIDAYLELAANFSVCGYDHSGDQFLDVGKPESLAAAEALLAERGK